MTESNSPVISLGNIRGFGGNDHGAFKMSNEYLGWKSKTTNSVFQYKFSEIESGHWVKIGNNCFRLLLKMKDAGKNIIYFDGFFERNINEVTQHFQKYYNINLNTQKIACRGWNWGEFKLEDSDLSFEIDKKSAFYVNTKDINQLNVQLKTDIAMELKTDENQKDVFLSEIRFYYPHETDENQTFQDLKNSLLEKVNTGDSTSESIASLESIPLLVPRGRYEIEMYLKTFKLHGKSYDFNIQYTNVGKMILVPKTNSNQYVLVFCLINKMKQGQTEYPFILFQLNDDEEMDLTLNANEDTLKTLKLEKEMSGKPYEIVTKLFTTLVNKTVIIPGDFRTAKGQYEITCSYRAASGYLYPLNRYFLFIIKPVILISFDDVLSVTFQRTGNISQHRFFSLIINHRKGINYEYTNIDKNEYTPLMNFLKEKNLNVQDDDSQNKSGVADDIESDEEDYVGEDDDDEDDYNAEEDEEEEEEEDDEDLVEEENEEDE